MSLLFSCKKKIIVFFFFLSTTLMAQQDLLHLKLDPNDAFSLYQHKEYEKALSLFSDLIKNNNADDELYFNRGLCYSKLHRYNEAILDYSNSLKIKPNESPVLMNRGIAYFRLSKNQLALMILMTP